MSTKLWPILAGFSVAVVALVGAMLILPPATGNGHLAVAVHDAPCSECAHVWVTFDSVAVHQSGPNNTSGWTTLNVSGTTVDLMALNGSAFAQVIGVVNLAPGHYEQIRLTVSKVVVALSNGTTLNASVPNGQADVNGAFNISSGMTTSASIDIDLASSLHVVLAGPLLMATFTPNIGSVVIS